MESVIINNLSQQEVLKYAIDNGILDLSYVQEQINMQKREEILREHPYSIWEGSNGRWYTYLTDETKKNNRKSIAKSTRKKVEDEIIKDAGEREKNEGKYKLDNVTLSEIKDEWVDYKDLASSSDSYAVRLEFDYDKYWQDSNIVNIPIRQLTQLSIETYLLETVKKYSLTKRKYSDMKSVINMMFDYAILKGIIETNIARLVIVNKKLFTKQVAKLDDEQVYSTEEEELITKTVLEDFKKNPRNTSILAIPLGFKIGDRIAEITVLKGSDIAGDYLHIQRQEIPIFIKDDGKRRKEGWREVDFTKTDAGQRWIYLVPEAKEIINLIMNANELCGRDPQGYLFYKTDVRIHTRTLDKHIRSYCKKLGIKQKSNHKIRKTFGSSLVDSKMNIDKATKIMGQVDARTLLNNYCFNRFTDTETENQMKVALNKSYQIV